MTEKEARERVKDLKSFYGHLVAYLLTNAGMLATFLLAAGPDALIGPLLVLFGWGGGLCVHASRVFGIFGLGSPAWEEQKVRALMRSSEGGLSRSELAQILNQAISDVAKTGGTSVEETERMRQRVEHLEAIVTNEDWDLLQIRKEPLSVSSTKPAEPDVENEEERAKRVAKTAGRVR